MPQIMRSTEAAAARSSSVGSATAGSSGFIAAPPSQVPPTLVTARDRLVARRATLRSMSREITQRELRNQSGEIMRRLDEGESFVVTRNGVPVGELAPLRRHRFVSAEAVVAVFRGAPAVDLGRFRADLEAIASQDPAYRG